jgi:hypothetical protein
MMNNFRRNENKGGTTDSSLSLYKRDGPQQQELAGSGNLNTFTVDCRKINSAIELFSQQPNHIYNLYGVYTRKDFLLNHYYKLSITSGKNTCTFYNR